MHDSTSTASDVIVIVKLKPTHNVCADQVPSGDPGLLLFAGQTVSSSTLVLVSLALEPEPRLTVNTENIVLGGMVIKEIRAGLEKA